MEWKYDDDLWVCGTKEKAINVFLSVHTWCGRGEDGLGHGMCWKRRKEQWT